MEKRIPRALAFLHIHTCWLSYLLLKIRLAQCLEFLEAIGFRFGLMIPWIVIVVDLDSYFEITLAKDIKREKKKGKKERRFTVYFGNEHKSSITIYTTVYTVHYSDTATTCLY